MAQASACLGALTGASRMFEPSTPLLVPQLGNLYASLAPITEALLRAAVGLALVPHALRNTFGRFAKTGVHAHNLAMLAAQLDRDGYRPGRLWAPLIAVTQLVCGPLLALGLFTRAAAVPIVVFLVVTNFERWRVGGYFWNMLGLEYTLMWTIAALYFLIHGGGLWSLDHWLIGREF
jgi:putative oxidoreductase